MLVLAAVLLVGGVVAFVAGLVVYTNGMGVAPHRRTKDDPTGVKRATKRVEWRDVFRRMPKSVSAAINTDGARSDRLAGAGSFLVLIGLVALCVGVVALIASFV